MRNWKQQLLLLSLFLLTVFQPAIGQEWGRVAGKIVDASNGVPIPNVTVLLDGTNFGTASDDGGAYSLRIPVGAWVVRYSAIGFSTNICTLC